jgi:hypothetical protein
VPSGGDSIHSDFRQTIYLEPQPRGSSSSRTRYTHSSIKLGIAGLDEFAEGGVFGITAEPRRVGR